tara:strand:+ start:216 stop:479 length:264 start_codon:yes stop_codon:yes gene_type:complete
MSLQEIRNQIDELDQELLDVLAKRMYLSKAVGEVKRKGKLEIVQPEREAELLEQRIALANGSDLDADFIKDIFGKIMDYSKKVQQYG